MKKRVWSIVVAVLATSIWSPSPSTPRAIAAVMTSAFDAVVPARVANLIGAQRLPANGNRSVVIAGASGVPVGASAVTITVMAASSTVGDLRVWPSGSTMPLAPAMTLTPGGPLSQTMTVPLGSSGRIDLRSSVAADVFVDVNGYYAPAAAATRGRFVPATSVVSATATTAAGGTASFDLSSAVPSDVEAVVVTARARGGVGTWSVAGLPVLSVRFAETAVNRVIVPGLTVDFVSSAGGEISVDVLGWYTGATAPSSSDGLFVSALAQRLYDTTGSINPLGSGVALHAGWTAELSFALAGAGAVLVNAFVSSAHGPGDVVVFPGRRDRGVSPSLVASRAGQAMSGQLPVALSSRAVSVWSGGGAEVAVDLVGWFTGSPVAATNGTPVNPLPAGDTFPGQIWIPDIKLRSTVRENVDFVDVDPVHIPESRSPNQPGNVAIFGHRTSHGREFRNINRLKRGSQIVVTTNGRNYTYSVTSVGVLKPDDPALWASASNDQTLTLVACHPPGSVRFRIVAFARLVSVA
ncbi:MAG: hypothetical protein B7C54_08170 [Acidimicrobiales bacterium mtb01]|nr:class E sortase [Actinomycetota bacterium]TEX45090.1 MAG: hypothetical protein B7C54_08170 [Acidimicrobiales bacterium mtb01]